MSTYPIITYDFPKGDKKHPFDINADGKYFIYASGFSYLFNEIDMNEIANVIPMGYKILIILERISIIEAGIAIKDWMIQNKEQSKFMIFSTDFQEIKLAVGKEAVKVNTVYRPDNIYNSFQESIWENYEECLAYAKEFSLLTSTDTLLTSVVLYENWH